MTMRRRAGSALIACLALVIGSVACASPPAGTSVAEASAPVEAPTPGSPETEEPAFITPHLTWVLQDGESPAVLCVGPNPRPSPTSCSGVTLVGWDWDAVRGAVEGEDTVRRGEFIVAGDYSAEDNALTVASVDTTGASAPQRDGCPDGSAPLAWHERPVFDEEASQFIAERFGISVPPGYSDECGRLTIGVAFDDGSIQAALDGAVGKGAISVVSALTSTG